MRGLPFYSDYCNLQCARFNFCDLQNLYLSNRDVYYNIWRKMNVCRIYLRLIYRLIQYVIIRCKQTIHKVTRKK